MSDLACYTGGSGSWNVVLSTGIGWNSQFWNGGPEPAIPVTDQCIAGDFNGDGKTDLACWTGEGGSWNVVLSTGSGWNSQFWNGGPVLVGTVAQPRWTNGVSCRWEDSVSQRILMGMARPISPAISATGHPVRMRSSGTLVFQQAVDGILRLGRTAKDRQFPSPVSASAASSTPIARQT